MKKKILEMLRKGISIEDIKLALLEDDETITVDTLVKEIKVAQKLFDSEVKEVQDKKDAEAAEHTKTLVEKMAKEMVEAQLKEINLPSVIDKKEHIVISENPGVWKAEMKEFMSLIDSQGRKKITSDGEARLYELAEKNFNSQKDFYKRELGIDLKATNSGSFVATDANGGYWVRQEFDAETDTLLFTGSDFINAVKIRPGDEKIAINGIQTVDYAYRTNDDTNFTKKQPTFTQDTITLKDAGMILAVSNRLLDSSFYDLPGELMRLAADAEIRLLEQQMTTGDDNESDEVFDGIWFTSGITSLAGKNSGGSGAIDESDMHNAYLQCAAQSRKAGYHIIRTEEFQYIYGKKDDNGRPLGETLFTMINGQFIHRGTGRPVLILDNMEKVNGVTNKTTQPNVPYMFGALDRFRFYRKGGRRVDFSTERYFEYDQVAWRFILANVQGIPTNSLSSFVAVTGLVETAVA